VARNPAADLDSKQVHCCGRLGLAEDLADRRGDSLLRIGDLSQIRVDLCMPPAAPRADRTSRLVFVDDLSIAAATTSATCAASRAESERVQSACGIGLWSTTSPGEA
jgi:hypothetical protein